MYKEHFTTYKDARNKDCYPDVKESKESIIAERETDTEGAREFKTLHKEKEKIWN
jgi:hypothetical protein